MIAKPKKIATIITGMGRSGTMWLANYLEVPHEPKLLEDTFKKMSDGKMTSEEALEMCEIYFGEVEDGHVEVSSYWRLFVPYLKKAGFRVLGLVRHPQDVVASIHNINGGKPGWLYPVDRFERAKIFESVPYLARLGMLWADACDRTSTCEYVYRFEDLTTDAKTIFKLCKSVGKPFDLPRWNRERKRKRNRTAFSARTFKWDSAEKRDLFLEQCCEWMARLGYQWRDEPNRRLALNIGCGIDYREPDEEYEWVNIDADPNADRDDDIDIFRMDEFYFEKCYFIEARDVLEHVPFDWNEPMSWMRALSSWVKCLAIDGRIRIQTPDPYGLFKLLETGEIDEMDYNRRVFSERTGPYEIHYQMISRGRLKRALLDCGGLEIEKDELVNGNAIVTARRVK